MAGLFVTGSGTGVGKTFVTAALCRRLNAAGRPVRALKPVISGWAEQPPEESDTGLLLAAQGRAVDDATIAAVSPWRFAAPLSPDMAAAVENRGINYDELVGFCREAIENMGEDEILLIEGVGGVMVPLSDDKTILDWMADLALPALLVCGSYLGSLSHTLTAALTLTSRGVPLKAMIVSESEDATVTLDGTVAALARHLPGTRIVALPRGGGLPDDLV